MRFTRLNPVLVTELRKNFIIRLIRVTSYKDLGSRLGFQCLGPEY